ERNDTHICDDFHTDHVSIARLLLDAGLNSMEPQIPDAIVAGAESGHVSRRVAEEADRAAVPQHKRIAKRRTQPDWPGGCNGERDFRAFRRHRERGAGLAALVPSRESG